jgi:DNA-binding transcriptional regulator YiaG
MNTIYYIRKTLLNLSQSDFAAILEVSQSTVSRWERGVAPSLDEMSKIRSVAIRRGVEWQDRFFFEVPSESSL